jgi:pilus assembly protein CpaE
MGRLMSHGDSTRLLVASAAQAGPEQDAGQREGEGSGVRRAVAAGGVGEGRQALAFPTVIVAATADEEQLLRRQLEGLVEICGVERDPRAALDVVRRTTASIALLCLDHYPEAVLDTSSQIARHFAHCSAVIVSRAKDPEKILLAMRAGARDFAYLDDSEADVRRAVVALRRRSEVVQAADGAVPGRLIVVFSCKGGSGSTTIATNLAGALLPESEREPEQAAEHVVVVDLDLQMGDVLVSLDLACRYSFGDMLRNLRRLDRQLLYASLTQHRSGIHVLAQSERIEDAEELTPSGVGHVLALLRRHFEYVVVDGLRDFGEQALVALDMADTVLLTVTQDVPALKNAHRCLDILRRLGYGDEKLRLVVNRQQRGGMLDLEAIADALHLPVTAAVGNDFPTVIKAVNEGTLLLRAAPRAQVTRDIRSLAAILRGAPLARKGLFGRLRRSR